MSDPIIVNIKGNFDTYYKSNIICNNDGFNYSLEEFNLKKKDNKTDICCWWCCHKFKTNSIPIPMKYNEVKEVFYTFGNFCSFSCSKAFIENNKKPYYNCSQNGLLEFMRYKITGERKTIKPSPHRLLLNMFGGPLTIEEFRKKNDSNYTFVNYPCISFESQIQKKEIIILEKENKVRNEKFLVKKENSTPIKKKSGLSSIGIVTIKK